MKGKKLRVAVYGRQTFRDDVLGMQVADQLAACRRLFLSRRRHRIESATVYMEQFTDAPLFERREFKNLASQIEGGGLDELFLYSKDCASTELIEYLRFEQFLADNGVRLRVALERLQ